MYFGEFFLGFTGVTGDGWYEGVMISGCRSLLKSSFGAQSARAPTSMVPNSRVPTCKLPEF